MKDDANKKLVNLDVLSSGNQTYNTTRTLTRSETFVRDSNNDDTNNLLCITHDVIPAIPGGNSLSKMSSSSLFRTRTIDSTSTADIEDKLLDSDLTHDTINPDVTIPGTNLTYKYAEGEQDFEKLYDMTGPYDDTVILAPDKAKMKLVLNSTMNCDKLLDISAVISPSRQLMNITRNLNDTANINTTKLLYMTQDDIDQTLIAQDPQVIDEEMLEDEVMEVDDISSHVAQILNTNQLQELKGNKPRYSFGLDLTECTLDCSIELCDVSLASSIPAQSGSPLLKKQNSFEMDESLGILTPDQMKEFLDSATTTTNLDLPINMQAGSKLAIHQMRIDQTPSPEDLPLDPVGVKTDLTDVLMSQDLNQPVPVQNNVPYQELSQTDSDSKTDQMTKSNVSKVSNSFITSVTSITSLDTGYQGDGEMSRPASRGAGDHSPSNGPRKSQLGRQPSFNLHNQANIPIRRQDPMTDSDFFTESDADDIFHRGDRRAQVIDGQLYGPMLQPSNVFITEQPQMEDSCMESSGIFTDVENRCDDDIVQNRREADIDMSPDGSTDTVKSNNTEYNSQQQQNLRNNLGSPMNQGHVDILTDSQTSSTIHSSLSSERISVSSIGADYSPQSKKNNIIIISDDKQALSSLSGSIGGGALTMKTTSSNGNDDKKCSSMNKQTERTSITVSSVKKLSPSRKQQHQQQQQQQHNTITYGGKYESKSVVNAEKNAKTVLAPSKLGITASISPTSLSSINVGSKKSTGVADCDMLVKHPPAKQRNTNQENKRPGGHVTNINNSNSSNCNSNNTSNNVVLGRKSSPNKWDAVMNKIAENKVHKKNYNEVKSKVATGVLRRSTPGLNKSPTGQSQDSNCGSVNSGSGLSTPQTKRFLQGATKRGRSFSKDSQQSSQSDLSLSGGSPKLQTKTSTCTRSAKKRDVRTLSISPTDLGPPPKTQTNGTARTKQQPVLSQKRLSTNAQQTVTSPLAGNKGPPPAKKIVSRRPQVQQTHTKVPLKDHNRLVGHTPQQQQNNSPKNNIHTGSKGTTNSTSTTGTPTSNSNTPATVVCGAIKPTSRHSLSYSPPATVLHSTNSNNSNGVNPSSIPQQSHNQKQLQQKSSKGALDLQLAHANKGIEALGVLLQYLASDLEAFSCPKLKVECARTQKRLTETHLLLEESRSTCHELQDQLHEKEAYYLARETELHALHRCELKKVETSISELEISAKERVSALEAELLSKDAANEKKFKDYIHQTEIRLLEKEQEIQDTKDRELELLKRISALSTTENELREKVLESENLFAERLNAASQRERELTDKVNCLNKQLDALRHETENRERELEDKLNLSHDEISVLRHSRNSFEQSISPKNCSSLSNGGGPNKLQMLQDEVESLRSVLELKQSDVSELRKQNHELKRASDELPSMYMKVSALESRIEDIQIQLKAKNEEEKELLIRNKHLQESYKHEVKNRNRLSLHNEELQWRLKQNSEKFALALTELSKSYQEQAGFLNISKSSLSSQDNHDLSSQNSSLVSLTRSNGSERMVGCFQMDDVSPPTSPVIKGVVEKSDSVSWVLEMDDESPEVLASRMVRRAGSFRSSFNEKSPNAKRQYSLPAGNTSGNPLTQSASATSVLRQHSSDSVGLQQQCAPSPSTRIRSKSVTIKMSDPKKLTRQNSGGGNSGVKLSTSWKEPICSSSPYSKHRGSPKQISTSPIASSSSSSSGGKNRHSYCVDDEEVLYRKQPRNLITCDTSALTSSDRIELRSLPSHPSVQDLKNLKKCQEIQESAGEAMVSGTNSEDEGCSASSDDINSSTSSASTSSLGVKRNMSIEDALLMDKMSTSFGGTPMEVSWSDDADQFASESIV